MQISDLTRQYQQAISSGAETLTGTKGVENLVASLRSLTKGNIFEGMVSSVKNGMVTLLLSGGQQVTARMDGKIDLSVGESMFFQVKSNDGRQIAISNNSFFIMCLVFFCYNIVRFPIAVNYPFLVIKSHLAMNSPSG